MSVAGGQKSLRKVQILIVKGSSASVPSGAAGARLETGRSIEVVDATSVESGKFRAALCCTSENVSSTRRGRKLDAVATEVNR
jgi:hypothetical protein